MKGFSHSVISNTGFLKGHHTTDHLLLLKAVIVLYVFMLGLLISHLPLQMAC